MQRFHWLYTANYFEQRVCKISVYGETCHEVLVQGGFRNQAMGLLCMKYFKSSCIKDRMPVPVKSSTTFQRG